MSALDKLAAGARRDTPEARFIAALRAALKEYDRETKVDLRRLNGGWKRRGQGRFREAVERACEAVRRGNASIRAAATVHGVSYGAVWNALQKEQRTHKMLADGFRRLTKRPRRPTGR